MTNEISKNNMIDCRVDFFESQILDRNCQSNITTNIFETLKNFLRACIEDKLSDFTTSQLVDFFYITRQSNIVDEESWKYYGNTSFNSVDEKACEKFEQLQDSLDPRIKHMFENKIKNFSFLNNMLHKYKENQEYKLYLEYAYEFCATHNLDSKVLIPLYHKYALNLNLQQQEQFEQNFMKKMGHPNENLESFINSIMKQLKIETSGKLINDKNSKIYNKYNEEYKNVQTNYISMEKLYSESLRKSKSKNHAKEYPVRLSFYNVYIRNQEELLIINTTTPFYNFLKDLLDEQFPSKIQTDFYF